MDTVNKHIHILILKTQFDCREKYAKTDIYQSSIHLFVNRNCVISSPRLYYRFTCYRSQYIILADILSITAPNLNADTWELRREGGSHTKNNELRITFL